MHLCSRDRCFKLASFGGKVLSDSVAYAAIKYSLDCSKVTVLSLGSHVRSMDLHSQIIGALLQTT